MQFYALEESLQPVTAVKALRQKDYLCPECRGKVRLRRGLHKQPHFFHLKENTRCFQHRKSLSHLQTQMKILSILPQGEAAMEKPFPSIGRIADVAWEEKQLVFEVQCSPISSSEVKERNQDYGKLGYQVVWLLHQKTFNKKKMSAAEVFLDRCPHYFTDINAKGEGHIYDQFEVIKHPIRLFRGVPLSIKLSSPLVLRTSFNLKNTIPKNLTERIETWPIYFAGDLLDCILRGEETALQRLVLLEERLTNAPTFSIKTWTKKFFYWALSLLLKKTFTNAK